MLRKAGATVPHDVSRDCGVLAPGYEEDLEVVNRIDWNHLFIEYGGRSADGWGGWSFCIIEAEAWLMSRNPAGYYARKFQELRKAWGGRCVMCGARRSTKHRPLEFAHLKFTDVSGRGRGRADRYHDIVKHPSCYVLVCRLCHILLGGPEDEAIKNARNNGDGGDLPDECPF